MHEAELKERFTKAEKLPDKYQARLVVLLDGLLDEAEAERKRNIRDCFGCMKDSPIEIDIEAMRSERTWY